MQTAEKPWTVIVAGGGYSGVLAANRVQGRLRGRAKVLLVTPDAALTERIRLHQLAVHGREIRQPYARLLARGIERIRARVVDLEPHANRLAIQAADSGMSDPDMRWLEYDALILALGSQLTTQIPMASPLSAALRDVAHAQQLSVALPRLAAGERVLVVGGGLSAIELAAELAEAYPRLQIELLAEQFAHGLDEATRQVLRDELQALGMQIREGARVSQLEQDGVRLEDGSQIAAALSVLASGFVPTPLPAVASLPQSTDGRVLLDVQLRVQGLANVFAAGDFAAPPAETVGSGLNTTRMGCVNAMPLGAHAADQVVRLLTHKPLQPFHTGYMIQCISIGRERGVVVFVDRDDRPTGRVVRGRVAAMVKELICRLVVGGLRLERLIPGVYAWPEQHRSGTLSEPTIKQLSA